MGITYRVATKAVLQQPCQLGFTIRNMTGALLAQRANAIAESTQRLVTDKRV